MLIKDLKQGYGKVRAERYKQRLKKFFVFGTRENAREEGGESDEELSPPRSMVENMDDREWHCFYNGGWWSEGEGTQQKY